MSGAVSGVQRRIKLDVSNAIYVHCNAHKLNLVLLNTVEAIPKASLYFGTLQSLYNFITVSLPRLHIFQKYQKECTSEHPFTLKALSGTRH